jgi:hypothetical protein
MTWSAGGGNGVRIGGLIHLLAYYVTWHMQHKLAPILFQDAAATRRHVPRFHLTLLSRNENVTPRRLLSG